MKDCLVNDKQLHFPIKKAGVWADAIRNRNPLILNDYESCKAKRGIPDGHVKINNLLVVPFLKEGKVISVSAVANKPSKYEQEDITQLKSFLFNIQALVDSKLAEKKVKESEEKYRSVIETVEEGIILQKSSGKSCYLMKIR